jgi:hypothetical protein
LQPKFRSAAGFPRQTAAGFLASTKEVYVQGAYYLLRSPDHLSEVEVRSYLLRLRNERGVARDTYAPHRQMAAHASTRATQYAGYGELLAFWASIVDEPRERSSSTVRCAACSLPR